MVDAEPVQKVEGLENKLWEYRVGENTIEVVTEDRLKELISSGQLGSNTRVRRSGTEEWIEASGVKALMPDLDLRPHPVIRFFARIFDLVLYGLALTALVAIIWVFYPPIDIFYSGDPKAATVTSIFTACTWAIWEPLFLAAFGTTPGKWLFNVRVRTAGGNKLTLAEGYRRSFGVAFKGMGFGIPIIQNIMWLASLEKVRKSGRSFWDDDGNFVVSHGKIGVIRMLMIAVFLIIYLADSIVSLPGSIFIWY